MYLATLGKKVSNMWHPGSYVGERVLLERTDDTGFRVVFRDSYPGAHLLVSGPLKAERLVI